MEHTDSELVFGIVATTLGVTAVGVSVDLLTRRHIRKQKEKVKESQESSCVIPRFWVACLLVTSYLMLIPGLSLTLFQAEIKLSVVPGVQMPITEQEENMFGLVQALAQEGLWIGAALVTIYAFVVPVVKAGLLIVLGLTWRQSGDATNLWRNRCTALVQTVSKWAAPDMFAYILLACLLRSLDQRPKLEAEMTMGLGFTCFCMFCVGSTVSALGIRRNPESAVGDQEEVVHFGVFAQLSLSLQARKPAQFKLSRRVRFCSLLIISVLFVGFMTVGLTQPSMEMVLDMDLLYKSNPTFKMFRRVVERLNLGELFDKEVSIWGCLMDLYSHALKGYAEEGVAFIMLAVFAVSMPIASFIALMAAGMCEFLGGSFSAIAADARCFARTVGHLSMLDVSIMGSIVVAISLRSWREKGCVVELGKGVPFLIGAELCRYAVFHLVMHQPNPAKASDSSEAGDEVSEVTTEHTDDSVLDLEHGSEPSKFGVVNVDDNQVEVFEHPPAGTEESNPAHQTAVAQEAPVTTEH